ncbi:hypothetical protein [Phenylobacterium sp.]|jgi:hypothetical protein|uniref:hypothetical protein n=1 Tax=Phenylobacterium sp. TaxID=1871053 RepID=UPI002F934178
MSGQIGGGTNDRPLNETVAETGPGLPDEAIGPEQRTIPEHTELAGGADAARMEQKLKAEVQARSGDDEEEADNPRGHA